MARGKPGTRRPPNRRYPKYEQAIIREFLSAKRAEFVQMMNRVNDYTGHPAMDRMREGQQRYGREAVSAIDSMLASIPNRQRHLPPIERV